MKKTFTLLFLIIVVMPAPAAYPASSLTLDSLWFSTHGGPPYQLDQADTIYTLATDVTVEDSAFLAMARDITLDLNGHTVTYNQCTPVAVANGGFESGSGTSVPNWNLSLAPSAAITSNTTYLFGNQVLRFSNISAEETIVSDPITLYRANHTYVAIVTPGHQADYRTTLTLKVVDTITETVLAYGESSNVERGFSAVAEFKPQTTNPIRLEVMITPQVATTLDLDDVRVVSAYDSGIIAAQQWSGDIPAMANVDTPTASAYNSTRAAIENFTLRNGTVVQGTGSGYKSAPLEFSGIHGLFVENVTTHSSGPDTTTVRAGSLATLTDAPAYGAVVRNCVFDHAIDLVANRMHGPSVIAISGNCDILIEDNQLRDAPQSGITGGNPSAYSYIVRNNDIRNHAVVVNAYAIAVVGIQNFDIYGNVIDTANGRGILIDGYTSAATENGRIFNNRVSVQELGNREYLDQVTARALRIRNNVDARGPHRNLSIYNNAFTAAVGAGQGSSAYACRVSWSNQNNAMDNANIVLEGNTFTAVSFDPAKNAKAFVLDGASQNINPVIRYNVFESNHIALKILDSDGGDTYDTDFISNYICRSTTGAAMAFQAVDIGYWIYQAGNIRLIDMIYESGINTGFAWSGSGVKEIQTGWLLHGTVFDGAGTPLAGASFRVSTVLPDEMTDETGQATFPVSTTTFFQSSTDPQIIAALSQNPIPVTCSKPAYYESVQNIIMASNMTLPFILERNPNVVIQSDLADNDVMAYPNPAKQHVFFLFARNITGEALVKVYNTTGECVARITGTPSASDGKLFFDRSCLSPGVYYFIATHENRLLKKGKFCVID